MIIVTAKLTFASQADRDRVVELSIPIQQATRDQEAGCHAYCFAADPCDPAVIQVYELWEDSESLVPHFTHKNYHAMLELFTQFLHRLLGVSQLGDTNFQMFLQFFEFGTFLSSQVNEVSDEVQEVTRRDVVEFLGRFRKLHVKVSDRRVNVNDCLRDYFVFGVNSLLTIFDDLFTAFHLLSEAIGRDIKELGELHGDLHEAFICPVSEPVNDTTIEKGGRTG